MTRTMKKHQKWTNMWDPSTANSPCHGVANSFKVRYFCFIIIVKNIVRGVPPFQKSVMHLEGVTMAPEPFHVG